MKIYLDVIIFINFFFDFVLLFGVNYLLKLRKSLIRLVIGSIIGGLSILSLFISLNSFSLFILKIIISMIIILVTFGSHNFFKNYLYFYILSIFLGGFMYLVNNTFSYKNIGLIFFHNGLSINFFIMIIITPIIIYLYIKERINYKNSYSNKYNIDIYINNKKYELNSYLDTGNTLKDPYKNRDVIIINNKIIDFNKLKIIYVPYKTISDNGLIKCIKPDKVIINKIEFKNCLIGNSNNNFNIDNSDCILPNKFKESLL